MRLPFARKKSAVHADKGGTRAETGLWGEKVAERFLRKKKYRILGRRVQLSARDELDLVARDGDVLVFVEVRTRKSEAFGRPMATIDRKKRHVISRAAVRYLKAFKYKPVCFRFDVVEVVGEMGEGTPVVRHIKEAFPLDSCYTLPF